MVSLLLMCKRFVRSHLLPLVNLQDSGGSGRKFSGPARVSGLKLLNFLDFLPTFLSMKKVGALRLEYHCRKQFESYLTSVHHVGALATSCQCSPNQSGYSHAHSLLAMTESRLPHLKRRSWDFSSFFGLHDRS